MKEKKKKEDRAMQAKAEFDAVNFEGKSLETCMLMLKSNEGPVIVKALSAIDKYAAKATQNLQTLYANGIIEVILPLVQHPDTYVRRFSTKILAEMSELEDAKHYLISCGEPVHIFMDMLQKETDVVVQEFCSLMLAEMSTVHSVCATLLDSEIPYVILITITSPDPDVQKNSLEIMKNLIKEPSSRTVFIETEKFSFKPLISLFRSDYPVIQQLAIMVTTLMTKDATDSSTQEQFRSEGGFQAAVEILEVLHENDITDKLIRFLQDESSAVVSAVCLCISLMCKFRPAIDIIYDGNPIQPITALLRSDKQPWNMRHNAAHAIHELLWCDIKFCTSFVEQKKQDVVLSILQQPDGEVPHEVFMILIQILRALCVNAQTRMKVVGIELVEVLHRFMKGHNEELQIIACQALSEYACESTVREKVVDCGCIKAIMKCLQAFSVPVKLAVANLIQKMVYNQIFVKAFIQAGGLEWMVDNRSQNRICPAWDSAIEAVFKNYLPAKFAYKGRLEMDDITCDGFYISRSKMRNFIILDELLLQRASPIRPVYIANFMASATPEKSGSLLIRESSDKKRESSLTKSTGTIRKGSETVSAKMSDKTEEVMARYDSYPYDPYLSHYLEQVKILMDSSLSHFRKEEAANQILKERVNILAKFVAKQMTGSDPGVECSFHSHDLHITEIKENLGSNIIPLGYVRVGYYLERAMLFKVLADRISLPCTLVRGNFGRGWVEIAMVEYTVCQDDTNMLCKVPSRICKPNCVVDLMNNVGEMLVLGSFEAKKYCEIMH